MKLKWKLFSLTCLDFSFKGNFFIFTKKKNYFSRNFCQAYVKIFQLKCLQLKITLIKKELDNC